MSTPNLVGNFSADTSEFDQAAALIDAKMDQIDEKGKTLSQKLDYYLLRSRTIASFIFNMMAQTAEMQIAQTMLHVAMTGVSIHRTLTQAAIAFGSQNYAEGVYLTILAGTMAANQTMALVQQDQQRAQQQQIQNMRNFYESYSG